MMIQAIERIFLCVILTLQTLIMHQNEFFSQKFYESMFHTPKRKNEHNEFSSCF